VLGITVDSGRAGQWEVQAFGDLNTRECRLETLLDACLPCTKKGTKSQGVSVLSCSRGYRGERNLVKQGDSTFSRHWPRPGASMHYL